MRNLLSRALSKASRRFLPSVGMTKLQQPEPLHLLSVFAQDVSSLTIILPHVLPALLHAVVARRLDWWIDLLCVRPCAYCVSGAAEHASRWQCSWTRAGQTALDRHRVRNHLSGQFPAL